MQFSPPVGTPPDPSQILNLAVEWATTQEQIIRAQGVPLSGDALAAAKWLGIQRAESIRLLIVDRVPRPTHPILLAACDKAGMPADAGGMCLGRGLFIRRASMGNRELVPHELVHAHQYERLGGVRPFLTLYLSEMEEHGYHEASLEKEARDRASEFIARQAQ